jgi:hypothetical protein
MPWVRFGSTRIPTTNPNNPTKIVYQDSALPQCPPGSSYGKVATACWQLESDQDRCPQSGQLVAVLRMAQELADKPRLDTGTKLQMQCRTCPQTPPGWPKGAGCDY